VARCGLRGSWPGAACVARAACVAPAAGVARAAWRPVPWCGPAPPVPRCGLRRPRP